MSSNFRKLVLIFLVFLTIFSSVGFLKDNSLLKRYNKKNEKLYLNYGGVGYRKSEKPLNNNQLDYYNTSTSIENSNILQRTIYIALENEDYKVVLESETEEIDCLKQLYVNTGNKKYIGEMINDFYLLASIYREFGYISLSEEYFNAANKLETKFNIKVSVYDNLVSSEYNFLNQNYKNARNLDLVALKEAFADKNKTEIFTSLINLARVDIKTNKLKEGKIILDEAIKYEPIINNTVQNNEVKMQYDFCCGNYYYKEKKYNEAIKYFNLANTYGVENNDYKLKLAILQQLGLCYESIGNYKFSTKYYKAYIEANSNYIKKCENINGTILSCIENSNPSVVINEILMNKNESIFVIGSGLLFFILLILAIFIFKNIKKKKKVKQLNEALYRDQLTGAYNRNYLLDRIEILKDKKEDFIVAMLDIDNYKMVNDTYGHLFGDKVLIEIVKTMWRSLGDSYIVGRYGGEEFLILCEGSNMDETFKDLNKLRVNISNLQWENNHRITISGGLAKYEIGEKVESILSEADEYLYKAKNSGKNRIEYKK